jgi:hypothetical protein
MDYETLKQSLLQAYEDDGQASTSVEVATTLRTLPETDALAEDQAAADATEEREYMTGLMARLNGTRPPSEAETANRDATNVRTPRRFSLWRQKAATTSTASRMGEDRSGSERLIRKNTPINMVELRAEAHRAANNAIELEDCAVHTQRGYMAAMCGVLSALFSITCVLLSPHVASFGFGVAASFSLVALAATVIFGFAFRGFLIKARIVAESRRASTLPDSPSRVPVVLDS